MTNPTPKATPSRPATAGPPRKHQLAVMIWLAVFPTLTVLNLTLGGWLGHCHRSSGRSSSRPSRSPSSSTG